MSALPCSSSTNNERQHQEPSQGFLGGSASAHPSANVARGQLTAREEQERQENRNRRLRAEGLDETDWRPGKRD